jgi:hypothetical protein
MKRLWCVWELFALMSFCNKELAVDRVEVIVLDDEIDAADVLRGFDLDDAHCFDPNEELKLRQIFAEIGVDRLKECLGLLADLIDNKKQSCMSKTA